MKLGWRLFCAVLIALCASLVVTPSLAQKKATVATLIKKGQTFFDEQRYDESIQTLSAALLRPGIAKQEKVQVYTLLAYNYIVLNRNEEADGAVRGLLVLDPEYKLPETESPRFRDFFEKVRKEWNDEGRPGFEPGGELQVSPSKAKIVHAAPDSVDDGASVALSGSVEDPDQKVSELKLFYRKSSKDKYTNVAVTVTEGKFSAQIPGASVSPPLVEYYIEARDTGGLPVATRGDADNPLRIAVTGDAGVAGSPALWVPLAIGVAAAIAVTVPVVLFATGELGGESDVTISVFESAPTGFTFRF
jgi:hypothetical protein